MSKRIRPWLRRLLWPAALGMLWWVIRDVSPAETWATLRRVGAAQIGWLLLVNVLALAALNGRWWLLLWGQGYRLPFGRTLQYRLAAFGLSYFTPGPQFGGEPLQVALVERRHGVPRPVAVSAMTLDKSLELLVNFTFLGGGVLLVLQAELFPGLVVEETAVAVLLLLALPGMFLAATGAGWRPASRLLRLGLRLPGWERRPSRLAAYRGMVTAVADSERQATRFCREAPLLLGLALLISIAAWGLLIGEYWLMLAALGLDLSLVQVVAALVAARIAFLLPLPGGLGSLEASQAFALGTMGVNPAAAVSAVLLIRARDVSLGGLGLWWGSRQWRWGTPVKGN